MRRAINFDAETEHMDGRKSSC